MLGNIGLPGIDNQDFTSIKNSVDRFDITDVNASFVGQAEDVTAYNSVAFFVRANGKSGILYAEFGNDANFLTMERVFPIDFSGGSNNSNYYQMQTMGKYFRMTCGSVSYAGVGDISVQTVYHAAISQVRKFSLANSLTNETVTYPNALNGVWDVCDGASSITVSFMWMPSAPLDVWRSMTLRMQFATLYDGNLTIVAETSRRLSQGQLEVTYPVIGQYFRPVIDSSTIGQFGSHSVNMQISLNYGGDSGSSITSVSDSFAGLFTSESHIIYEMDILLGVEYGSLVLSPGAAIQRPLFGGPDNFVVVSQGSLSTKRVIYIADGEVHCISFSLYLAHDCFIGISDKDLNAGNTCGIRINADNTGDVICRGGTAAIINNPPFSGFSFRTCKYRIIIVGSSESPFIIEVYDVVTSKWYFLTSNFLGFVRGFKMFCESQGGMQLFPMTWSQYFYKQTPLLSTQTYAATLETTIPGATSYQVLAVRNADTFWASSFLIKSISISTEPLAINRCITFTLVKTPAPLTAWTAIDTYSSIERSSAGLAYTPIGDDVLMTFSCVTGESKLVDVLDGAYSMDPHISYALVAICNVPVNLVIATINMQV